MKSVSRLGLACHALFALTAATSWSAGASAHDLGISRMQLTETARGDVHARFTFAAREADEAFDGDGHVAVDVKTDGVSCTPGPATSTPQSGDGLVVDEDFRCARATASIEAVAYFVSQMSGSHEDVAILETPEGTHEELLRPSHRTITATLNRPRRESPHPFRRIALATGGIALLALLAFVIRSILRR